MVNLTVDFFLKKLILKNEKENLITIKNNNVENSVVDCFKKIYIVQHNLIN